jgi:hypothetical protein
MKSIFRKLLAYLMLKRDKEFAGNRYLKAMHRINKISLFVFLFALIYLLFKLF